MHLPKKRGPKQLTEYQKFMAEKRKGGKLSMKEISKMWKESKVKQTKKGGAEMAKKDA